MLLKDLKAILSDSHYGIIDYRNANVLKDEIDISETKYDHLEVYKLQCGQGMVLDEIVLKFDD